MSQTITALITLLILITLAAVGTCVFSRYKFYIPAFKDQEILRARIRVLKAINLNLATENDQLRNQNATNFEQLEAITHLYEYTHDDRNLLAQDRDIIQEGQEELERQLTRAEERLANKTIQIQELTNRLEGRPSISREGHDFTNAENLLAALQRREFERIDPELRDLYPRLAIIQDYCDETAPFHIF